MEPKKPNLPLPSGGQIFLWAILVMANFRGFLRPAKNPYIRWVSKMGHVIHHLKDIFMLNKVRIGT